MNNEYECRYLFEDKPNRKIVQRNNRESKSFFTDEQLQAVPIMNKRSKYGNYQKLESELMKNIQNDFNTNLNKLVNLFKLNAKLINKYLISLLRCYNSRSY